MPGADFDLFFAEARRRWPWLPEAVAHGYARRYGTRMAGLLEGAGSLADLGRPFGGTLYEREARFLVETEWARGAADVLDRRTKHGLHLTAAERAAFTGWFEATVP
jgi:glycerol-3-phosphate dehydrogenase